MKYLIKQCEPESCVGKYLEQLPGKAYLADFHEYSFYVNHNLNNWLHELIGPSSQDRKSIYQYLLRSLTDKDEELITGQKDSLCIIFPIDFAQGFIGEISIEKGLIILEKKEFVLGIIHFEGRADLKRSDEIWKEEFRKFSNSLSNELIRHPASRLHYGIQKVIDEMGMFFRADRAYIFEFDKENKFMSNTYEWCARGVKTTKSLLQFLEIDSFGWWMDALRRDKKIFIPDVSKLGDDAEQEREYLQMQGIRSLLVLPVFSGSDLIGFTGFDFLSPQPEFNEDWFRLFRQASDQLAGALMRKRYEEALSASEAINDAIVSTLPDLIFILDKNGIYLDVRCSTEEYLLLPPDSFIGEKISKFFDEEISSFFLELINNALADKKVYSHEYEMNVKDLKKVYEIRFMGIDDQRVLAIVRDITKTHQLLHELRQARDAAQLASKAKSQFLANMSHELRTPLNSLMGYVNIIEKRVSQPDLDKYLKLLHQSSTVLVDLINNLFEKSALDSGKIVIKNDGNFNAFIMMLELQAAFEVLPDMKKSVQLIFQTDDLFRGKRFFLDEVRIRQVMTNLIDNAIKFTDEGEVEVVLTSERLNEDMKLADLIFEVRDTGTGIPECDQDRIFEAFEQLSEKSASSRRGAGLGLAITKQIVEAMNGRISLSSKEGLGSVFTIVMPDVAFINETDTDKYKKLHFKNDIYNIDNKVNNEFIQKESPGDVLSKQKNRIFTSLPYEKWMLEWDKIKRNNDIEEIILFGQKICQVAEDAGEKKLFSYGKYLIKAADSFDVGQIKRFLQQFPDQIGKIRDDDD